MTYALAVIDIQREYITEGRPYCIKGIDASLGNAAKVLGGARLAKIPIVHIKHLNEGTVFNAKSEFSEFVDGFEPNGKERVAIKGDFSSYHSSEYRQFVDENQKRTIIVIGYGSTMCCLSTIIDGYHRGHKYLFVRDASSAKATKMHTTEQIHPIMSDIMTTFAKVNTTEETLELLKAL